MTDEVNVPMDATAMQAEDLVRAAIKWAWANSDKQHLTRDEWMLLEACENYGDQFKGLSAR
jgi:hypothetical protein